MLMKNKNVCLNKQSEASSFFIKFRTYLTIQIYFVAYKFIIKNQLLVLLSYFKVVIKLFTINKYLKVQK